MEYDTIKKKQNIKKQELELKIRNNKKYKIEAIWDNKVYANMIPNS